MKEEPLLAVRLLDKQFRGLKVLDALSLNINEGAIKTIIGPNGAGKTTLFNIISGLERPDAGRILFRGDEIGALGAVRIAQKGISRTFQSNQVMERLNVIENIMLGRYLGTKVGFFMAGLWLPRVYREEHRNMQKAYEVLEFLGLYEKANRKIYQISHMERRLVEMGRAVAMEPKLLLLDEPFGGLTEKESRITADRISRLKERGMTVVVIDHHFGVVSDISDEMAVLHEGTIIARGTPREIENNSNVRSAYFKNEPA